MRTTVRIDDDLFRRAKARAATTGQTVGEVLEDVLREALRPKRRAGDDVQPLPTFGAGGVLPGIDLADNAATLDRLDEGSGSMRCVDVNVLVYAHRSDAPAHELHRSWLDDSRVGAEPVGLADLVASGFVRVVTHPRIFRDPTPLSGALDFVEALRSSPSVTSVAPGERHWDIFVDLCRSVEARGNTVPDAYLAAMAIEQNATWVTADRGFARFPGLRFEHPSS